ncbi:ATP-binding protein [bacterium 19CA06SA08-2]|uniref:ATP-binding protein n=1 Tax=bacterium 19CA06SA08-2 TaxID=2920658 RepID=A0AAU6UAG9_UNCXX
MPDSRFPILGTAVPPMLGREALLQNMIRGLSKPIPDHLQVVGPRFAGKTVILHELAARLQLENSPYSAVLVWDLGHQTPATDSVFMHRLASELASVLQVRHSDYAAHLKTSTDNVYQDIAEVLEALREEGCKVLIIMDGFDKPLSNGQLTRNLWDQLRELALKSSLRLVTSSRRTLRDLIRQPDAQTSDFWNIFEPTPVRVGCFNESDLAAVLAKIPERKFETGAQTEIWNASNGFPVLMLGVLNAICEMAEQGPISAEQVRTASSNAFSALRDKIDALWLDCSPQSQDLLRRVLDERCVSRTGMATEHVEILIERGFLHSATNKLQRPSSLLREYLEDQPHEGNSTLRLFGTPDEYMKNFKAVLERRLGHLCGIDPALRRYLERGADDLPAHPAVFLTNVRGIVNQAFELIWKVEVPAKRIPSEWISLWKRNGERLNEEWEITFPQGGQRLRLLNLMTGTDKSMPCAKFVSRRTYALMNAANTFGDFGQHQEGAPVDTGTAYSVLHLCVELASVLTIELAQN